jgi:PAS domain S-box-containing protein
MNENQCKEIISEYIEKNASKWEKPDRLILKLTLITLSTYNLLFIYQLVIHRFLPKINIAHYEIITNIYLCLAVNIASCLILYRYQGMANQVEQELARRSSIEQALQQTRVTLEERVAERTADLEKTNQGFILEILARERMEDDLKKANENLENIFNNSADPIGIVDQRGRIIKWNKASEKAFGYSFEELEGKSAFELYADKNELQDILGQLRRDGLVRGYEIHMKKKDGEIMLFALSINLL